MKKALFTPEELEELRRFDEEIDAEGFTCDELEDAAVVEGLLFPEREKQLARRRELWKLRVQQMIADGTYDEFRQKQADYAEAHKEEIAARRHRYYEENKELIQMKQREYRIRKGLTMSPEEKARKKAENKAKRAEYMRAYRAAKKAEQLKMA